ncbi:hypothetical protein [Gemmata sp.]|uniref:hypothetical protein n=1 Tax=Gemmata sp. TaxID=1914242 RepID=UPI003F700300
MLFGSLLIGGAAALAPAADPTAPAAPLELVLTGDKLARVELRVEVDGRPVAAVWDETFAKLFAFLDRNSDGALDAKEAAAAPSALALRQALGNGFAPPTGAAPEFAALVADADGKVTEKEFAAFYRRAGLGNALVGAGRLPASADLTAALLKHLDADADGKVTEKELRAAADALRPLDKNDDELIGAGELVPKVLYPGAAGTTLLAAPTAEPLPDVLAKLPLVLLPADARDTHWAAQVVKRRAKDSPDTRSAADLAAWRAREPDARVVVKLGGKPGPTDTFAVAAGTVRVEGWVAEGKVTEAFAAARGQFRAQLAAPDAPEPKAPAPKGGRRTGGLAWLVPAADRDGDGTLSAKELDAWLAVQEHLARGQVLLSVLDAGNGLFELLDTNHDGALSPRELRGAADRLKEVGCLRDGVLDTARIPHLVLIAASRGYPVAFGTDLRGGAAWFRAMDRNGDGDVSRREFTGPADVFDRLDLDRDGLLGPAEADKAEVKR